MRVYSALVSFFSLFFTSFCVFTALLLGLASPLGAQSAATSNPDSSEQAVTHSPKSSAPPQPGQTPKEIRKQKAAEQLKAQEHQRILGIFPNFNVSNIPDAVALSSKQKFQLALHSALDPVQFGIAAVDAGISQAEDDYKGYGQGAQGYFKRWGASYADNFDGAIFGGAVFPSLLHQDPRYFRKGTGSFSSRLYYALLSTIRTKGDNGKWQPNYSNILGNIAAGGIANIYYPSTDRGAGLVFSRAFTVTAEGAAGGVLLEFWPDVSRYLQRHRH